MADSIWRCTAFDPNGIRRCFGEATSEKESAVQCTREIMDYLKVRPDLGPLDKWTLKFDELPEV